ncbi:unnamed protein product [Blepharisma stoltei]|uniref:Uncharacterized protein n=1 Tax=Blepharisma stoltei TaxID=1481888 RepID=A0AAU9JU46_9CILI|nr:unnamed protein product [Blepharisma stoltei]
MSLGAVLIVPILNWTKITESMLLKAMLLKAMLLKAMLLKAMLLKTMLLKAVLLKTMLLKTMLLKTMKLYFLGKAQKNSVRVNLTDFSKSEQQIDFFKTMLNILLIFLCVFFLINLYFVMAIILYLEQHLYCIQIALLNNFQMEIRQQVWVLCIMMALFYLFGGWDAYGNELNKAAKYELSTDKWYKICPLNEVLSRVSCIAGNYGIAFVGYESSKLYLYHHKQDIYNEIYLKFAANTNKVLLQAENRVLLIESGKNIYESESNQLTNWKIIGAAQISFGRGVAYKVYFNQSCYFMDNNDKLYKFDMKSLQLTMNQL